MKSNILVQDPQKRPICPKVAKSSSCLQRTPSRFRRRKQITNIKISPYNRNFKKMPEDF